MQPITRIKVENFLSLRHVEVRLDPLNVLVGPNGAGKTNLLKVFHFLGDVARSELAPAVAEVGGFRQLLFRGQHPGTKKDTSRNNRVNIEITGIVTEHASHKALDEYKLSFWERRVAQPESKLRRITLPSMLQRYEELKFKRTEVAGVASRCRAGRSQLRTQARRIRAKPFKFRG